MLTELELIDPDALNERVDRLIQTGRERREQTARETQDAILETALRQGWISAGEAVELRTRVRAGLPVHQAQRAPVALQAWPTWIDRTAPAEHNEAIEADPEPVVAKRPPLDIPDWLL